MRFIKVRVLACEAGFSVMGAVLSLAIVATLAVGLSRSLEQGFLGARKVASLGEAEDLRNLFRMAKIGCEASLYKPNSTDLIAACTEQGGYLELDSSSSPPAMIVGIPSVTSTAPTGIADTVPGNAGQFYSYTRQMGKYDVRASCPATSTGHRLMIEYRNSQLPKESDWKDLFKGNSVFCTGILGGGQVASATTASCPSGQYPSGVDFANGTLTCSPLPEPVYQTGSVIQVASSPLPSPTTTNNNPIRGLASNLTGGTQKVSSDGSVTITSRSDKSHFVVLASFQGGSGGTDGGLLSSLGYGDATSGYGLVMDDAKVLAVAAASITSSSLLLNYNSINVPASLSAAVPNNAKGTTHTFRVTGTKAFITVMEVAE